MRIRRVEIETNPADGLVLFPNNLLEQVENLEPTVVPYSGQTAPEFLMYGRDLATVKSPPLVSSIFFDRWAAGEASRHVTASFLNQLDTLTGATVPNTLGLRTSVILASPDMTTISEARTVFGSTPEWRKSPMLLPDWNLVEKQLDEVTWTAALIAILLVIFPIITVFGNSLVVLSVYTERSLRSSTNFFIVSLAFADILVGALVMPFAVYDQLVGSTWRLGDIICDIWIACDVLACTASILNLVAISVDRLLAVTKPILYATNQYSSRIWISILLAWTISAIIASPIALGANNMPNRQPLSCTFYNAEYIIVSSLGSFYIPSIAIVAPYYIVFRNLQRRAKRIHRMKYGIKGGIASHAESTRTVKETVDREATLVNERAGSSEEQLDNQISDSKSPSDARNLFDEQFFEKMNPNLSKRLPKRQETKPAILRPGTLKLSMREKRPPPAIKSRRYSIHFGLLGSVRTHKRPVAALKEDIIIANSSAKRLLGKKFLEDSSLDSVMSASQVTSGEISSPRKVGSPLMRPQTLPNMMSGTQSFQALSSPPVHRQSSTKATENTPDSQELTPRQCPSENKPHTLKKNMPKRNRTIYHKLLSAARPLRNSSATQWLVGPSSAVRFRRHAMTKERKATIMTVTVLALFFICWVPFFTANTMNALCIRYFNNGLRCVPNKVMSVFVWLGYINSIMNPVVYAVCNSEFRKAFRKILRLY